jgi:ATP phosphoribosyltransferase
VLIRQADAEPPAGLGILTRRLEGVITAREYVLMDYVVPATRLEEAVAITPGKESPTVSMQHHSDARAVRVMVPRRETNRIMDALYDVGARAIIVTSIHASRL